MAADNAANRAVFVQNCNQAWAENDARYAALGMPRPANDCNQRLYGQTLPGTTGSAQQAQIPVTYIQPTAPSAPAADSTATVGAGGGWTQPELPAATPAKPAVEKNPATTIQSVFSELPGGSVSIGGTDVPWVLIGGGLLLAFLMMRGK
jgi:hypothetical protein